ncbi:hypothetical protein QJQ45_013015 [Haematococcus lacustris]|nr:hypothetical protein QJQ45_013015 [Haematococcus lacustris]
MASSPVPQLDAPAPLVQRQALQPSPTSSEQQQPQEAQAMQQPSGVQCRRVAGQAPGLQHSSAPAVAQPDSLAGARAVCCAQLFNLPAWMLEREMAEWLMKGYERAKQLVVFFATAGIGTGDVGALVRVEVLIHTISWSQEATQPAASEPGPSIPPPAKRSNRIKAEQAAEPTQPTEGKGKAEGKPTQPCHS